MAKSKTKPARASKQDAVELLKADHRQVEEWFEEFEESDDDGDKQQLATQICDALKVHTAIEEEIFYPAFKQEVGDEDIHNEAIIEHQGAKNLIAEIGKSTPNDEYFDARVKVLSEMIKHHVKEEEQSGGMFAQAKKSDMDLAALGARMAQRKQVLEGGAESRTRVDASRDDDEDDEEYAAGESPISRAKSKPGARTRVTKRR